MVVQHNLQAMNSNRMLGITQGTISKSTEKLSSGYKINRAADDAAGLSISEKMRKQIRGLTQASLNAEDGISAVQTAEGALTEVHDMLQRMNELAVKAANGTNDTIDKEYIQDEIDQLIEEIDRVSTTTKFNDTFLLQGKDGAQTKEAVYKTALASEPALANGATQLNLYAEGGTTKIAAADIKNYFEIKDGAVALKEGVQLYKSPAATGEFGAQKSAAIAASTDWNTAVIASSNGLLDNAGKVVEDLSSYFDEETGVYKGGLHKLSVTNPANTTPIEVGAEQIDDYVSIKTKVANDPLELSLQVGADSSDDNSIKITIKSMSAASIGVDKLDVSTEENAKAAIDTIAKAIQTVSEQRSALGAVQNRLEHTVNNLNNVVENTTAAESQIRDTDMATEMVKYSNNNILAQAGQAMLAQSNQANQGVLSLLQ